MQIADRKTTMAWIAVGLLTGVIAILAAWFYWPRMQPMPDPADRLMLAVQCCAGVGLVAFVMLQGLWRLSPDAADPFAGTESRGWKINQRVFTNTVEQALIFVPVYLALSLRMQPEQVHMLPALMAIWCAGRLMFWAGYRHSLHARAIGMDWTTVTACFSVIWLLATLF